MLQVYPCGITFEVGGEYNAFLVEIRTAEIKFGLVCTARNVQTRVLSTPLVEDGIAPIRIIELLYAAVQRAASTQRLIGAVWVCLQVGDSACIGFGCRCS